MSLGTIQPVFLPEQNKESTEYLKDMEARLFGLNITELTRPAYQITVKKNSKKNNFKANSELAGRD